MSDPRAWKSPFSGDSYFGSSGSGSATTNQQSQPKKKTLADLIDEGLGGAGDEAMRLQNQAESSKGGATSFLQDAFQQASAPSITDAQISNLFGQQSDQAGKQFLSNMGNLRSYLGGMGVTGGGLAGGLASGVEMQRLGQVTDAKRGLMIEKARSDALDKARNFANAQSVAGAMGRDPSTFYMDYLSDALGIRLGQSGIEAQLAAAKAQAKAAKGAGKASGGGDVLGEIAKIVIPG